MKSDMNNAAAARFVTALLMTVMVIACTGKNWFSYTGWEAKPENRQALKPGGPHAQVWRSPDLVVDYRYHLEGDRLNIEGQVIPQKRIAYFDNLQAWVNIHLLDEEGVILDTHRLWSARGDAVYIGPNWDFAHSWQLPPDNEAVGFSFTGLAGKNDLRWDFWQTP